MSESISSTRLPIWLKLRPMVTAAVVLPSLGEALVISRLRGTPVAVANCSAVRTER